MNSKFIKSLALTATMLAASGISAMADDTYNVKMANGTQDADKWTISPNPAQKGEKVTLTYSGKLKVKSVTAKYTPANSGNNGGGTTGEKILDLAKVTDDVVIEDGYTVIGTLDVENYPVCVSIADGATIILDNISIMGRSDDYDYEYAGLECEGDATIILKDGTTNNLRGYCDAGGIYIQPGKTLTIKGETEGTGVLNAKGNGGYGAGIGSGGTSCGNIVIEGGVINAEGGEGSPGIGAGTLGDCGNITITGGTITAIGHGEAAGIGGGGCWLPYVSSHCGNITITDGVTSVTATKGEGAPCAIGPCKDGGCGTVTIGGKVYYDGSDYVNGGDSYLTQETLVYPVYLP
ncbi:MAG: hypothetical protein E7070_03265 [Bacteroidales bacterium]|nr:hypothetical protein [Bacteroidales bacterium]